MNTYGGTTRLHRLQAGDALDRRRMEELFLQAGRRFNNVYDMNIGNKQFGRGKIGEHSVQEFWYNTDSTAFFYIPRDGGSLPGSAIRVRSADTFMFGELSWSLMAMASGDDSIMLMAWPVFSSKALWSGEDWALKSSIRKYPFAGPPVVDPFTDDEAGLPFIDGDYIALGGTCNFAVASGDAMSGLLLQAIGKFVIRNIQMQIRLRNR